MYRTEIGELSHKVSRFQQKFKTISGQMGKKRKYLV